MKLEVLESFVKTVKYREMHDLYWYCFSYYLHSWSCEISWIIKQYGKWSVGTQKLNSFRNRKPKNWVLSFNADLEIPTWFTIHDYKSHPLPVSTFNFICFTYSSYSACNILSVNLKSSFGIDSNMVYIALDKPLPVSGFFFICFACSLMISNVPVVETANRNKSFFAFIVSNNISNGSISNQILLLSFYHSDQKLSEDWGFGKVRFQALVSRKPRKLFGPVKPFLF